MSKKILDYDAASKTTTYHHFDHSTGKTHIETVQDVQSYLKRNKELQRDGRGQARGRKMDFMHIATIPNAVIMKIKKEHNIDVFEKDELPKLERLLQSSEYQYLRTVDKI